MPRTATLEPAAPARPRRLGRRFRTFQAAVLSSNLADGIYLVTIPLLALSLSGAALAVSAVGVALRAPWLLLMLPAGVVADRFPPLSVLRCAAAIRLPLVILLSVLAWREQLPIPLLLAGAFLIAACGTCADIAAQSLVPRLVSAPLLPAANANLQTGQTLAAQFAGPALGGLLAHLIGVGVALAAVLYGLALLGLGLVRHRPSADRQRTGQLSPAGMVRDLATGIRYFRTRRDLVGLASVAATGNLAFSATTTMLPVWIVSTAELGLPASTMGLVSASPAAGGLLAGTLSAWVLVRLGPRAVLRCCAPAVGGCFLLVAVPALWAVLAAMAIVGGLTVLMNVMSMSHRQATIPAGIFGRANAVYRWIVLGASPVGALLGGATAYYLGLPAMFAIFGGTCLLAGLVLPVFLFRPGDLPPPIATHPPED